VRAPTHVHDTRSTGPRCCCADAGCARRYAFRVGSADYVSQQPERLIPHHQLTEDAAAWLQAAWVKPSGQQRVSLSARTWARRRSRRAAWPRGGVCAVLLPVLFTHLPARLCCVYWQPHCPAPLPSRMTRALVLHERCCAPERGGGHLCCSSVRNSLVRHGRTRQKNIMSRYVRAKATTVLGPCCHVCAHKQHATFSVDAAVNSTHTHTRLHFSLFLFIDFHTQELSYSDCTAVCHDKHFARLCCCCGGGGHAAGGVRRTRSKRLRHQLLVARTALLQSGVLRRGQHPLVVVRARLHILAQVQRPGCVHVDGVAGAGVRGSRPPLLLFVSELSCTSRTDTSEEHNEQIRASKGHHSAGALLPRVRTQTTRYVLCGRRSEQHTHTHTTALFFVFVHRLSHTGIIILRLHCCLP